MKLGSINYLRVYLYGIGHRSKYVVYTKSMNKDLYTMSQIEQEINKIKSNWDVKVYNNQSSFETKDINDILKNLNIDPLYNEENCKRRRFKVTHS
jgi:predicted glutamine amidotransferase